MIDGAGRPSSRNRLAWIAAGAVAIVTIDHMHAADVRCAHVASGAALLGALAATRAIGLRA